MFILDDFSSFIFVKINFEFLKNSFELSSKSDIFFIIYLFVIFIPSMLFIKF